MPRVSAHRETASVVLPSIPEGKVEVYRKLMASDLDRIVAAGEQRSQVAVLALLIKDWNLEDPDGKPYPVTKENIGALLDLNDANAIITAIGLDKDFLAAAQAAGTPMPSGGTS